MITKSIASRRQILECLTALIALGCAGGAMAASFVEVAYRQDGQKLVSAIYSGKDGGAKSDAWDYWALLSRAPMFASDVTIQPDAPGGKLATLKGKIEVSITIRNRFNKGVAKTDRLELIRDAGDSGGWHLSKAELKRVFALVKDADVDADVGAVEIPVPAPDARALLQAGKAAGEFPADLALRVQADMWEEGGAGDADHAPKHFQESWELTSDKVYLIVREKLNGKSVERRAESRPFDASLLCKELLDGKIFAIEASEAEGESVLFAGTDFAFGIRSIELIRDFDTLVFAGESCVAGGYAEPDARAFAALYERLAQQARAAFATAPARATAN